MRRGTGTDWTPVDGFIEAGRSLGKSLDEFASIISELDRQIAEEKSELLDYLPMPWPEFNRMCWRTYGTGRTYRDPARPYIRSEPLRQSSLREFNRYCWSRYGTGRTEPDE